MTEEVQTSMLGIDQLAAALATAQAQMGDVPKSGINPAFKSADKPKGTPFSTLGDVIGAIRKPLTDNGLSWMQPLSRTANGVAVTTIIMHKSGQRYSSTLEMPCGASASAQAIGSAISYGRRYSLMAMMGLAGEDDDDGNAAVESHRNEPQRRVTPQDERGHSQAPASGSTTGDPTSKQVDDAIAKVFKEIRGVLPEATAGDLRTEAGFSPKGSLSIEQRTVLLRSMEQKLKALQTAVGDDDIPF